MMFGTREEFDYVECAACGCLQIGTPPADLRRFYPPAYYAFAADNGRASLRDALAVTRVAHVLGRRSLLGRLLVAWRGYPAEVAAIARIDVPRDAAILDVGCGDGVLLRRLAAVGFSRLHGVDPFVPATARSPDGVTVFKARLEAFDGRYDVVMLHHSLEHMEDPLAAMSAIRRLLSSGGTAIVRTPVADSTAWRLYGADWVQLDAPRHLFVHSRQSVSNLAERAGLEVSSVVYDSTAFQFWGSELYRSGVPLYADRPGGRLPGRRMSRSQMRRYEREARELNERQLGDQACFYLRPRPGTTGAQERAGQHQ